MDLVLCRYIFLWNYVNSFYLYICISPIYYICSSSMLLRHVEMFHTSGWLFLCVYPSFLQNRRDEKYIRWDRGSKVLQRHWSSSSSYAPCVTNKATDLLYFLSDLIIFHHYNVILVTKVVPYAVHEFSLLFKSTMEW